MQALAAGYSGYAGASAAVFGKKVSKTTCLTNTFEKRCLCIQVVNFMRPAGFGKMGHSCPRNLLIVTI
jgi:hypothetical protein